MAKKAAAKPAKASKAKKVGLRQDVVQGRRLPRQERRRAGRPARRLKKEQFNLRFQRANGQAENTGRIRVLRRDIARIQTVLNEQRRATAKA